MIKNIRREDWKSLEPSVCGWGINDVNYNVQIKAELEKVNSRRRQKLVWRCPYYTDWRNMIERCHCQKYQEKHKSYKGCSITDEWKYLSKFIEWVDSQPNKEWQECDLDKDFLHGKVYSPDTCLYIPQNINKFLLKSEKSVNGCMIGTRFRKNKGVSKYTAQCNDPFTGCLEFLGTFTSEIDAHLAWKSKKHQHACALADLQLDLRLTEALRNKFK